MVSLVITITGFYIGGRLFEEIHPVAGIGAFLVISALGAVLGSILETRLAGRWRRPTPPGLEELPTSTAPTGD